MHEISTFGTETRYLNENVKWDECLCSFLSCFLLLDFSIVMTLFSDTSGCLLWSFWRSGCDLLSLMRFKRTVKCDWSIAELEQINIYFSYANFSICARFQSMTLPCKPHRSKTWTHFWSTLISHCCCIVNEQVEIFGCHPTTKLINNEYKIYCYFLIVAYILPKIYLNIIPRNKKTTQ